MRLRMFGATLLLAFREIRRHLLRSFLTTLGIIIGVAAVITMVTLGRGLTADVQEDIAGLGSNVFIVFPESVEGRAPPPFEDADIRAVERQIPCALAKSSMDVADGSGAALSAAGSSRGCSIATGAPIREWAGVCVAVGEHVLTES